MDKSYDFKFNFPIQLKADTSTGQFYLEGYACTTDLDRQDEVILRTALEKALEDVKQNRTVFYEHKSTEYPIGKIVDTKIVDEGSSSKLYVKVYISKTAEIVRTLIEEGILNKFSIGGKVLKYKKASLGGKEITEIQDMELYEVSVVGLPANVKAEAIGYEVKKSLDLNSEKKEEVKLEKSVEEKAKEEELIKALEAQKIKEAEEAKALEIKKAEEVKAAEELKKAEEVKAAEELKKAEELKAEELRKAEEKKKAEAAAEVDVLDAKMVMDALGRMEAMISQMAEAIKAQKVEVKKDETPKEIKASVNMEEVEALIKKAVDATKEELLKVVGTKGRKGLVIQESAKDETHKETPEEINDSLTVLEDEKEFNKKTPEEKTKIIREGFLKILQRKTVED